MNKGKCPIYIANGNKLREMSDIGGWGRVEKQQMES